MSEIVSSVNAVDEASISAWRAAQRATLLLATRGELVDVALIADGRVLARHNISAAQLAATIADYARLWQAAANAANQGRSFITAVASGGQGGDTGVPVHPVNPKGEDLIDVGMTQQILHTGLAVMANALALADG